MWIFAVWESILPLEVPGGKAKELLLLSLLGLLPSYMSSSLQRQKMRDSSDSFYHPRATPHRPPGQLGTWSFKVCGCATLSPSWMWRSQEVRTAHWDANVSTWGNVASDGSLQITSANPTWGPRTKKAWWWESDKQVSGQRSRPFTNLSGHCKYHVILIFGISSLLIFIELIQQEGSSFVTLTMNILHYCDQLLTCSKKVEEIKAQSKQQSCRWEWRHKSQFRPRILSPSDSLKKGALMVRDCKRTCQFAFSPCLCYSPKDSKQSHSDSLGCCQGRHSGRAEPHSAERLMCKTVVQQTWDFQRCLLP